MTYFTCREGPASSPRCPSCSCHPGQASRLGLVMLRPSWSCSLAWGGGTLHWAGGCLQESTCASCGTCQEEQALRGRRTGPPRAAGHRETLSQHRRPGPAREGLRALEACVSKALAVRVPHTCVYTRPRRFLASLASLLYAHPPWGLCLYSLQTGVLSAWRWRPLGLEDPVPLKAFGLWGPGTRGCPSKAPAAQACVSWSRTPNLRDLPGAQKSFTNASNGWRVTGSPPTPRYLAPTPEALRAGGSLPQAAQDQGWIQTTASV